MPLDDYSPLLNELLVSLSDFWLTSVPGHSEHAVRIELGCRGIPQNKQDYSQTAQTAQEGLGGRSHLLKMQTGCLEKEKVKTKTRSCVTSVR